MLLTCIALVLAPSDEPAAPVLLEEPASPPPLFHDATAELGLGPEVVPEQVARVAFVHLDGDDAPDLVIDRQRVFLNRMAAGEGFVELQDCGLPVPVSGGPVVFADLDGDGRTDALVCEVVPVGEGDDHGERTRWLPGLGDGTFGEARPIPGVRPGACNSVAVADVNRDGALDLWIGGWYEHYGVSYAGQPSQLLYGNGAASGELLFLPHRLPADGAVEDRAPGGDWDAGGRPTYGSMVVDLEGDGLPELLEANYGRRANRLWWRPMMAELGSSGWIDDPGGAFAGDDVRHGRYPDWAVEAFARRDPPIERPPEDPFRSHGNSFDLTAGDVDRDGTLDLVVSDITHGWAGESSDRTRLLLRTDDASSPPLFAAAGEAWSLDRNHGGARSWNQGDLFCQLADLDLDGWVDLLVSSGDYPDDQRLRWFRNEQGQGFRDATVGSGLDHDGSQQLSLADVDRDGDLDLVVGQTFNRYPAELRAGREPAMKLYLNQAVELGARAVVLRLFGDGEAVSKDALGVRVRGYLPDGSVLLRELNPIGGHSGKQNGLALHLGLGEAEGLDRLVITWPDAGRTTQLFGELGPGRYEKAFAPE